MRLLISQLQKVSGFIGGVSLSGGLHTQLDEGVSLIL